MWAMHCPSDVAALRLGLALELVLLAERVQVADDASLGSEAESGEQHSNKKTMHTPRARQRMEPEYGQQPRRRPRAAESRGRRIPAAAI